MPKGIDKRVRADESIAYRARKMGPNGRSIVKTFNTEDEAVDWLQVVHRQVRDGKYQPPSTMTVAECVERHIEQGRRRWQGNTPEMYQYNYERWIKPSWIGRLPLSDLTLRDVQRWIDGIDVSPGSVRLAGVTLGTAVKEAVRLGIIPHNPTVGVRYPTKRQYLVNPWSRAEVQRVYATVQDDAQLSAIYRLSLTIGLRSGELRALHWSDMQRGRLHIHRTASAAGEIREGTKTNAGRIIALPASVTAALDRWQACTAGALIFPAPRNLDTAMSRSHLTNLHHQVIDGAGVKRIRVHDMRHTAATLMLEAGVPLKVVSDILGHASIAITGDVYQWVDEDMQRSALNHLDGWIEQDT